MTHYKFLHHVVVLGLFNINAIIILSIFFIKIGEIYLLQKWNLSTLRCLERS